MYFYAVIISKSSSEWYSSSRQPWSPSNKIPNGKLWCFSGTCYHSITLPFHSPSSWRTRPKILKLSIIQCIQCKITTPFQPSCWIHQAIHEVLQVNCARVFLPWPPQVGSHWAKNRFEIICCHHSRVVDWDSRVLVWVGSALSRDHALLPWDRFSCVDHAVLENYGGITEDEIDRTINVAFSVELSLWMHVESVLVSLKTAPEEHWEIGTWPKGYCLVVFGSRSIAECDATGNETFTSHSWKKVTKSQKVILFC